MKAHHRVLDIGVRLEDHRDLLSQTFLPYEFEPPHSKIRRFVEILRPETDLVFILRISNSVIRMGFFGLLEKIDLLITSRFENMNAFQFYVEGLLKEVPPLMAESALINILEMKPIPGDQRMLVIQALADLGTAGAVEYLGRIFQKRTAIEATLTERMFAIQELGRIWTAHHESSLLAMTQGQDVINRELLDQMYTPTLLDQIEGKGLSVSELRMTFGYLLAGRIAHDTITSTYVRYLNPRYKGSPLLQQNALRLVGTFSKNAREADKVIPFLSSENSDLREEAERTLRKMDTPIVVDELIKVIEDRSAGETLRVRTVELIGQVGDVYQLFEDRRPVIGLTEIFMTESPDSEVFRALCALFNQLGEVVFQDLIEVYEIASNERKIRILEILANSSDPEVIELVRKESLRKRFQYQARARELYWHALNIRGEAIFMPMRDRAEGSCIFDLRIKRNQDYYDGWLRDKMMGQESSSLELNPLFIKEHGIGVVVNRDGGIVDKVGVLSGVDFDRGVEKVGHILDKAHLGRPPQEREEVERVKAREEKIRSLRKPHPWAGRR